MNSRRQFISYLARQVSLVVKSSTVIYAVGHFTMKEHGASVVAGAKVWNATGVACMTPSLACWTGRPNCSALYMPSGTVPCPTLDETTQCDDTDGSSSWTYNLKCEVN